MCSSAMTEEVNKHDCFKREEGNFCFSLWCFCLVVFPGGNTKHPIHHH